MRRILFILHCHLNNLIVERTAAISFRYFMSLIHKDIIDLHSFRIAHNIEHALRGNHKDKVMRFILQRQRSG